MNVERIRERLGERFQPFAVVMSSGNKYPVPHADFIFLTSKVVVVANEKGGVNQLDPLHIVTLEDLPETGNLRSKRRQKHS